MASLVPLGAIRCLASPAHALVGVNQYATSTGDRRSTATEDAINVEAPQPLVQKEFEDVPAIGLEELKAMMDAGTRAQVIDARPRHYFPRSTEIMQGAVWRDPDGIGEWAGDLAKGEPVVVFCAYDFHVGSGAAAAQRKEGLDARYLSG